ncbi:acetolactate synthase large subunit [Sphingomonadaceae bacterium jetA1]|uniref:acetolactate synthase large subunit n=1 Tax=Facivitalis istanbulensis TaxID=3075838 RepID=UPI00346C7328
MNETRNGAQALLEAAQAAGAEICFANPGTTELTLVHALQHVPAIRPVLGLFEGVCTGAADGYARISGRVALTLLHLGPGFANGIANLHNARRAHSSIVNIIGDHATWHLPYDAPLTSDIESLAGPVSAAVVRMASLEAIDADVARAFDVALAAPAAVATVIAPTDIMDAPAPVPVPVSASRPGAMARRGAARVADARIDEAVAVMQGRGDVILLLGGDALTERGLRAAARIAAATRVRLVMEPYPAVVSLGGDLPRIERQAYFPDDVLRQFADARVVLAGARAPISYFGYEGQPSELVAPDRLTVMGAAGDDNVAALEAVAGRIGAAPVSPPRIADVPVQPGERLTPEAIVEELVAQLPHDAIISLEGSTLGGPWLRTAHRAARHRVMTNTGGAIGQGLPCAVGAALAAPEARIIALQSDGSGHYTLQALWTMARERLPVTIIIAANHRYGILQTELTRADVPLDQSAVERLTRLDHPRADWTALAAGYGVAAIRVDTPEAFADALRRGLAEQGPLLIQAELP